MSWRCLTCQRPWWRSTRLAEYRCPYCGSDAIRLVGDDAQR